VPELACGTRSTHIRFTPYRWFVPSTQHLFRRVLSVRVSEQISRLRLTRSTHSGKAGRLEPVGMGNPNPTRTTSAHGSSVSGPQARDSLRDGALMRPPSVVDRSSRPGWYPRDRRNRARSEPGKPTQCETDELHVRGRQNDPSRRLQQYCDSRYPLFDETTPRYTDRWTGAETEPRVLKRNLDRVTQSVSAGSNHVRRQKIVEQSLWHRQGLTMRERYSAWRRSMPFLWNITWGYSNRAGRPPYPTCS